MPSATPRIQTNNPIIEQAEDLDKTSTTNSDASTVINVQQNVQQNFVLSSLRQDLEYIDQIRDKELRKALISCFRKHQDEQILDSRKRRDQAHEEELLRLKNEHEFRKQASKISAVILISGMLIMAYLMMNGIPLTSAAGITKICSPAIILAAVWGVVKLAEKVSKR